MEQDLKLNSLNDFEIADLRAASANVQDASIEWEPVLHGYIQALKMLNTKMLLWLDRAPIRAEDPRRPPEALALVSVENPQRWSSLPRQLRPRGPICTL